MKWNYMAFDVFLKRAVWKMGCYVATLMDLDPLRTFLDNPCIRLYGRYGMRYTRRPCLCANPSFPSPSNGGKCEGERNPEEYDGKHLTIIDKPADITEIRLPGNTAAHSKELSLQMNPAPMQTPILPKNLRGVQSLLGKPTPPWKRGMDIAGSILGLMILSPIFLVTALLITMVSPGPVFFSQKRVGYRGKPFYIWKFRTMRVDADTSLHQEHVRKFIRKKPDSAMVKIDDDPRLIPFGKILRKTAIDELPQLFNVLRGEMSLVGPRPDLTYAVQSYEPWATTRFDVVPGMTGLWQVSGKNKTTYYEMMRLDIRYVQNRSFRLDIKILLKTFPVLIHLIAEKSRGS